MAATGATAKSATHDALISILRPVETWDPVHAIDVDPMATFEGKPVNYSVIIAYQPPKAAPERKRAEVQALLDLKRPKTQANEGRADELLQLRQPGYSRTSCSQAKTASVAS
ncbi:hypothetical protein W97_06621 [Coniosporium apollinis CBS 100218]|uniref:Uncharacterized protein n=1 Tax=Coniosporium apollinis (strain CBS 100218) TaxID=1168221 RepID=R7YZV3_CONA1|nr:uncharacterized protein W97_06621 [Coniosporium apollinis CBS 100218]EON67368.1 hypothetical protein W97_06621 [Coniosporium apollinis CBS 100218]